MRLLTILLILAGIQLVQAQPAAAAVKPPGPNIFQWLGGGRVQWFNGALNALIVYAKPWEDPGLKKWHPWESGVGIPQGAIVRIFFWGESNYPSLEGSQLSLEINNPVNAGKAEGWEKLAVTKAGFCIVEMNTANRPTGPQIMRIYYDSKRRDVVNAVGGFIFMLQPLVKQTTTTPPVPLTEVPAVPGLPAGVQIVTHPSAPPPPPADTAPAPPRVVVRPSPPVVTPPPPPPPSPPPAPPVVAIPAGMAAVHVVTNDGQTASIHVEVNGVEVAARYVGGSDVYFMVPPGYVRVTADPPAGGGRWTFARGKARPTPVGVGQTLDYVIHLGR